MENNKTTGVASEVEKAEEIKQYLIFQSGELKLGIDVQFVVETIINHPITRLPMLPNYVCGVLNLRGEVIPAVDIRVRLGQPAENDSTIIVLNMDGMQLGILVDRVDQIVKLPPQNVQPMPQRNTQKLFCGMSSLPNKDTVIMVDVHALLENTP